MRVIYDVHFDDALKRLPENVHRLYRRQESIFRNDWQDPRLHIKKLINHPYSFSFRITSAYRVLFLFVERETAFFATIAHRKDVYR